MMGKLAGSLLLVATLAGCAAAPPARQAAGASVDCIEIDQIVTRRVAGPNALEFQMIGGRVLRNDLASACPGLQRLGDQAVVAVTSATGESRLCRGDRVRVFDPVEAQATGLQSYPECLLGDFAETAQQ